jgi:23S rRNA (uracil1939-C5)-methyltransferase
VQIVKGQNVEIELTSAAYEGSAIGRVDELVVFVRGGIPGDRVLARVTKLKKRFAEAVVETVLRPSTHRVEPICRHFGVCGGCTWQNAGYELQLEFKQRQVADLLERIAVLPDLVVKPTLASPKAYHYRNKMEFTFGPRPWMTREEIESSAPFEKQFALGLHVPGRFDKVLDLETCYLQAPITPQILDEVRRTSLEQEWLPYDSRAHEGYLRNLVIRISEHTKEVMVNLVTSWDDPRRMKLLVEGLRARFPEVTTVINTLNSGRSPVAAGEETVYYGTGKITERIGPILFAVEPSSFFQPNSLQAEQLYGVVKDFAGLSGSENVLDLYCGMGGISLFLAKGARAVEGVENHSRSVQAATMNAERNSINNCRFVEADVAAFLKQFATRREKVPDVVILDPPRAGMHPDVCASLLQLQAARIVYVSCNPATQARDLLALKEGYLVEQVQPIDMFPQTYHIENVVALSRKIVVDRLL